MTVIRLFTIAVVSGAVLVFSASSAAFASSPGTKLKFDHSNTACKSTDSANDLPSGDSESALAFANGTLYVDCWQDNTITAISPKTGAEIAVHHITAASGPALTNIGSLAWDPTRNEFWACENVGTHQGTQVGLVNLSTNTFTPQFDAQQAAGSNPNKSLFGCTNGMAYDQSDGTLWMGLDSNPWIEHYTTSGTLLSAQTVQPAARQRSGIAVVGSAIYLSDNKPPTTYVIATDRTFKTGTSIVSSKKRYEGLACDDTTFPGTTVIWVQWNNQNVLLPVSIGNGGCNPAARSLSLSEQAPGSASADSQVTYTGTVTNSGAQQTNVQVTAGPLASGMKLISDSASQGSCSGSSTVTCSLGTIAPGGSATVSVTVAPLAPGSYALPMAATSTQQSTASTSSASVSVTGVSGVGYVSVTDSGFAPGTVVNVPLGGIVQWNFLSGASHEVADSSGMGLFDTGLVAPVDDRQTTFTVAGSYAVNDPTDGDTYSVHEKLNAPATASVGTPFTLTWATSIPSGYTVDVQVKLPGASSFTNLALKQTTVSGQYTAASKGTYTFRARLHASNGKTSAYSPNTTVSVS